MSKTLEQPKLSVMGLEFFDAFLCAGFEHVKEATALQNGSAGHDWFTWGAACACKQELNVRVCSAMKIYIERTYKEAITEATNDEIWAATCSKYMSASGLAEVPSSKNFCLIRKPCPSRMDRPETLRRKRFGQQLIQNCRSLRVDQLKCHIQTTFS